MKIKTLPNGNLEMSLTPDEIKIVKRKGKNTRLSSFEAERWFIKTFLPGFENLENQVACCSAPVFGERPVTEKSACYGFMSYAVESFMETLCAGKAVTWTKGKP